MNRSFAIAYADKNGNGFSETKPWILDDFGLDLEGCIQRAKEMILEGYKNVIPFQFGKREREEYSWKYVRQHKLDCKIMEDIHGQSK